LKLRKTPKEEIKKRVDEAAEILDIVQLLDKQPQALSSEQRQKVALGRAIVRKPKVFLMDEPLSNLEAKMRVQMRAELSKLHQRLETTFIYVTHDQTEAMMMGTRLVVMKDGFIQQIDSPEDLYSKPNNMFVAGFIGSPQMNFINVMVVKKDDQIHLVFGKNEIVLPGEAAKKLEDAGYIGREVVMGIRSENVYDEETDVVQMAGGFIKAKVQSVKTVGAETYLYMTVEGVTFIARVDPKTKVKAGEVIKVIVDMNKIHLFDADTQRAIIN
jgi:multiple sugar transport system ATP-binding protein